MIRNLKVLLLAALAVTAVGAISASSASAHKTAERFTNLDTTSPTLLTTEIDGEAKSTTAHQVFDVPGNGGITCNAADFKSTVEKGVSEPASLTFEEDEMFKSASEPGAGFTECKFLGQTATVNMNTCTFVFKPHDVATSCEAGKEITFSAAGCTVNVPGGQTFLEAVKYENFGAGAETLVTVEIATKTEIKGSASGVGCLKAGAFTEGQYTTGNITVKGWTDPKTATRKGIKVDFI